MPVSVCASTTENHNSCALMTLRALSSFYVLLLIPDVECLKLVSPAVAQPRAVARAEHGPITVLLHALHEEVRDPERQKKFVAAVLLRDRVLAQVEEVEDVRVPRLQIHDEGTRALASTLVHVARSGVEHAEHGHQAVRSAIGATDVAAACANLVDVEANASSRFGDLSACFERVVDALDRVVLQVHEEARRHLRVGRSRVEECRAAIQQTISENLD